MKIYKKILGLGIAAIMTISACSITAFAEEGNDPEATLITVGGEDVPLKKGYFLMRLQQASAAKWYKAQYGSLWYKMAVLANGQTFQDAIKENVAELLVKMTLARQNAEEMGVTLSSSEEEAINKAVETYIASNSQEALDTMMADEVSVREILEDMTYLSKVITPIVADVKVEYGEIKSYSYIYKSLLYEGAEDDSESNSPEMIESRYVSVGKDFEEIRKTVVAGGNFDTTASNKGYAPSVHTFSSVYKNDPLLEVNDIVDKLEVGAMTGVIRLGDSGVALAQLQKTDEEGEKKLREEIDLSARVDATKTQFVKWKNDGKVSFNSELWSKVGMEKTLNLYSEQ